MDGAQLTAIQSKPAATDTIKVFSAGTQNLVSDLTNRNGAPLPNPFTVAQAGGVDGWGFRPPSLMLVDWWWEEGQQYLGVNVTVGDAGAVNRLNAAVAHAGSDHSLPAHKSTHATGGSDALTPADIGAVRATVVEGPASSEVHNSIEVVYLRNTGMMGQGNVDISGGTVWIDAAVGINSVAPEWQFNGASLVGFAESSSAIAASSSVALTVTDGSVKTITPTANFELLLPPDPVGAKSASFMLKIRQGGTAYSITAVKKSDGGAANYTHWNGTGFVTTPPALAGANKLTELLGEWDTGISKWLVRFGIKES